MGRVKQLNHMIQMMKRVLNSPMQELGIVIVQATEALNLLNKLQPLDDSFYSEEMQEAVIKSLEVVQ